MEAVNFIVEYESIILGLIITGSIFRIIYFCLHKTIDTDEDVVVDCNAKIKRTLYMLAIAISLASFINIIKNYY